MIGQLKKIANPQNCRIGKRHAVLDVVRKNDNEFVINGIGIYVDMDGSWTSNPPIQNLVLKTRINDLLKKMKRCASGALCDPAAEFDMLEKCTICKRVS